MSLSEGDTVYMCHNDTGQPDYFVVFKLDKPQTVQFKHHWDCAARWAKKTPPGAASTDRNGTRWR